MEIVNLKTHSPINFESFVFPGGEINVKIMDSPLYPEILLKQRIKSSDDLMELLIATDALRRMGVKKLLLNIPYVPYARQDREMAKGEALSIKVFCNLINQQKYDSVHIFDPHSSVTPALLENCVVKTNEDFVRQAIDSNYTSFLKNGGNYNDYRYVLISPDAGAEKKVWEIARSIGYKEDIIVGTKHRDLNTGHITHTTINTNEIPAGTTCFILDDICDGGRTFIELGNLLKQKGASKVYLVVSHGIFSAGFQSLGEILDGIYVTDSYRNIETLEYKGLCQVEQYKIY